MEERLTNAAAPNVDGSHIDAKQLKPKLAATCLSEVLGRQHHLVEAGVLSTRK